MAFTTNVSQWHNNRSGPPFFPSGVPSESKILFDANPLIHHSSNVEYFLSNIAPELKKKGVEIGTSASVMNELDKLIKFAPDPETRNAACKAWNIVITNQKAGLFQIYGDKDDETHADLVWLSVALKYRNHHPLFIVTQDNDLADDLELLNHLKSTHAKYKITVLRFTKDGTLKARKHHA